MQFTVSIMWTSFPSSSVRSKDEKLANIFYQVFIISLKRMHFVRYDTLEVGKYN